MFRLRRTYPLLVLAALAAPFSGCQTMYRDVYSPEHNYFVPPVEKAPVVTLPDEKKTNKAPALPIEPPPATPPSAPAIPGMEALPGAAPAPMAPAPAQ